MYPVSFTYNLSNHKTKTNHWDIFEQLWQTNDNQGIIFLETEDSSYFKIAISFFTENFIRFVSGKLVSVTKFLVCKETVVLR